MLVQLYITLFLAYPTVLPTEIRAAPWPISKSLVFLQWRYFLNINAAIQSGGGIIENLQFTSHDCYASLRVDNWEMIEGNKKSQSHTTSSTCMFLIFKD